MGGWIVDGGRGLNPAIYLRPVGGAATGRGGARYDSLCAQAEESCPGLSSQLTGFAKDQLHPTCRGWDEAAAIFANGNRLTVATGSRVKMMWQADGKAIGRRRVSAERK